MNSEDNDNDNSRGRGTISPNKDLNPEKYAQYNPKHVNLLKVMGKSFALGVFFTLNLFSLIYISYRDIHQYESIVRLNVYFLFICIFHSLEFINTVLFNNSSVDDDSFILEDEDMNLVVVISIIEYIIHSYISTPKLTWIIGIIITLFGQIMRSLAMYTAQESFNHYIQRKESYRQQLVTKGIYGWIRHPSYCGFFWWFVGLQVFLGNWIILIGGIYKLWNFFDERIQFEEIYLIKFYKMSYVNYKDRVKSSGIPFI
ncbi:Isoprenylcysteine carboxyl methyltransferase family-domain-containing protein [Scheffersomyces amazonensis]|uniref:Isoprenylcysteine carboxyl methyltransferase family-domain-containing protein n=1 Tax=Scheffersomyces amazonensis TaxID=1078765 RepID=UPI00315D735B